MSGNHRLTLPLRDTEKGENTIAPSNQLRIYNSYFLLHSLFKTLCRNLAVSSVSEGTGLHVFRGFRKLRSSLFTCTEQPSIPRVPHQDRGARDTGIHDRPGFMSTSMDCNILFSEKSGGGIQNFN